MTCETAVELISAKLDGELTADEMTQLDRHLAQCSTCRALLEELTAIHAACSGLEAEPPAALREQILQNLPAQDTPTAEKRGKVVPIHWRRWTAMAASFAVVALAAWHLPQFASRPPESVSPSPLVLSAEVANDSASDEGSITFTSEDSAEAPVPTTESIAAAPIPAIATSGEADPATADATESSDSVSETAKVSPTALLPDSAKNDIVDVNFAPAAGYAGTAGGVQKAEQENSADTTVFGGMGVDNAADAPAGDALPLMTSARMAFSASKQAVLTGNGDEAEAGAFRVTAADGETPEPHPEMADGENVPVTLFVQGAPSPVYCGVLTLQGGTVLNGYPAQVQENGETQYELPRSAFFALLEELTDSETDFTLRMTGTDVSSAAENGLVIVLP